MRFTKNDGIVASSFRDPCGFLFWKDGQLYRQVNRAYKEDYDHFVSSGLKKALTDGSLLIPYEEVSLAPFIPEYAYRIIKPEPMEFISYPYEWCFSQLKEAALLTLQIQLKSMEYGMALKDCSAYNIQFSGTRPIFVDTLSFELYAEGQAWVAYRQFCQHFLAPLALMSKRDIRLNQLLRIYIDGIPLDLTAKLLPLGTRFSFPLLAHVHLHAASQQRYAGKTVDLKGRKMSRTAFMGLIDSLDSAIRSLQWQPFGTEWAEYYEDTNYSPAAFQHKKDIIAGFIDEAKPTSVLDLGANTGVFSRLSADKGIPTVACDMDPAAVEKNYFYCVNNGYKYILPLVIDLANPSGGIGWENRERETFIERGRADTVFALAIIHHLAISNNLPFSMIADFMNRMCNRLVIEYIPKDDSQVKRLLSTRNDLFLGYTQQNFEAEFSRMFEITGRHPINESDRTIYIMKRR